MEDMYVETALLLHPQADHSAGQMSRQLKCTMSIAFRS
jgi:hypothetical protein